jgi:hypothetical protein
VTGLQQKIAEDGNYEKRIFQELKVKLFYLFGKANNRQRNLN